jgi:hypothetical protein
LEPPAEFPGISRFSCGSSEWSADTPEHRRKPLNYAGAAVDGYDEIAEHRFALTEGDPLSAAVQSTWTIELRRGSWQVRIETAGALTADARQFYVTNELEAYEGSTRISTRSWSATIPRDQV